MLNVQPPSHTNDQTLKCYPYNNSRLFPQQLPTLIPCFLARNCFSLYPITSSKMPHLKHNHSFNHYTQTFIVPPLNPNRQHPYNPQSHGGHLSHPYNNIECLKNPNVPHSKSPHHDTTTHREEGPRNLNGGSPLRSLSLSIPLAEYVSSSSSNSFGRCHCLP